MSNILNVRSAQADFSRAADDLTGRARIRDAAIVRFANDGFSIGLRAIAADAGASVGLVAHHFGSKAGLRAACDAHVLAVMRDAKSVSVASDAGGAALLAQLADVEEYGPVVGYVLRTLREGGDSAREFVRHVAQDAEEYIAAGVAAGTIVPSHDEPARIRYLVRTSLGALVLAFTLDPLGPEETLAQWFRRYVDDIVGPSLEVMTHGLLADASMLDAYRATDHTDPGHASTQEQR